MLAEECKAAPFLLCATEARVDLVGCAGDKTPLGEGSKGFGAVTMRGGVDGGRRAGAGGGCQVAITLAACSSTVRACWFGLVAFDSADPRTTFSQIKRLAGSL